MPRCRSSSIQSEVVARDVEGRRDSDVPADSLVRVLDVGAADRWRHRRVKLLVTAAVRSKPWLTMLFVTWQIVKLTNECSVAAFERIVVEENHIAEGGPIDVAVDARHQGPRQ